MTELQLTKLELALRLVQEVIPSMDDSTTECECCGVSRYNDWKQYKDKDQLAGVARKLQRLINNRGE